MSKNYHAIVNNGVIAVVFGLVATLGMIGNASAASDYKVISKKVVAMGEWDHHQAWRVIRFYLPKNFDSYYNAVLQMNISSTNKSQYSALYLNPYELPGHEFEGCSSIDSDRNEHERVDYLPTVPHKKWQVYHKTIDGNRLQAGDNYLLVCSRNKHGEGEYELDNFYLKDIVLHYRQYEPAPEFCPAVYEPVCGVDGQTYSNACEANSAQIEIHHEGDCSS